MKHITLVIGLLVVGCGKGQPTAKELPKETLANKATAKPVKELTLGEKV